MCVDQPVILRQQPEGSHRSGAAWANYHHRHPSVSPPRIISEETVVEEADEQDLDDDLSSLSDIDLDDPLPSSASGTSPVKGDDAEVLIAALKKAPPGRIRPKFWKRLAARVRIIILSFGFLLAQSSSYIRPHNITTAAGIGCTIATLQNMTLRQGETCRTLNP